MPQKEEHIVIIGNGISGTTAARHARKIDKNCRITIISSETKYFFSRTALMYVYMGHMKFEHTKPYEDDFWPKNRIDLVYGRVESVDFETKALNLANKLKITYDKLVLALGSVPNTMGWPGEHLRGVQGLYSCQDLMKMEESTAGIKSAVVVGGGLIGIEMAEMLISRGIKTTMLVRDSRFWSNVLTEKESQLIENQIALHGLDLKLNESLKQIKGDENGRVSSIITESGNEISCEFVGLTIGVKPNIEFVKDSVLETNRGVLVNQYLETNISDVYAIGDCAEFRTALEGRKNIEQVWYTGRMMGETLGKTLTGERTAYQPGNWFNSAKFFDIEYQTYGHALNILSDDFKSIYWENDKGTTAFRMIFHGGTNILKGLNVFGIRLRHEVIDRMLTKGVDCMEVIENWKSLNFDPEFYHRYQDEIVQAFENQTGRRVKSAPKSWRVILNSWK